MLKRSEEYQGSSKGVLTEQQGSVNIVASKIIQVLVLLLVHIVALLQHHHLRRGQSNLSFRNQLDTLDSCSTLVASSSQKFVLT